MTSSGSQTPSFASFRTGMPLPSLRTTTSPPFQSMSRAMCAVPAGSRCTLSSALTSSSSTTLYNAETKKNREGKSQPHRRGEKRKGEKRTGGR
eukprot:3248727-Pleurochrysis_carterae.AAC.1